MDRLPQNVSYNPAFVPNVKFHLVLPGMGGVALHAYNSGFHYDAFKNFSDQLEREGYRPDEFVNSIGEYNKFFTELRANLFSLGFKLKEQGYFSFDITMNNSTTVNAASDIAYLLADYDNLQVSDFPLKVDDVSLLTNNYLSIGFTYSRKINEHLTLGISPHLNLNLLGVKSNELSYVVNLEEESEFDYRGYDQTFNGEAIVGLPTEINPDAIDGDELDLDQGVLPDNWSEDLSISDLFKNKSLSIDLGATYEFNEWTFSASILNIGASGWKHNAYLLEGDDETVRIKERKKVSIGIPAKIYLGANRQFSPKWNYGLVINNAFYPEGSNASATLSLNGAVGRALSTSVSYTAGYKFNNIGFGFRLRFLPGTDLYFVTDNIIQSFNYRKAQRLSAAFGINFSFGVKEAFDQTTITDEEPN